MRNYLISLIVGIFLFLSWAVNAQEMEDSVINSFKQAIEEIDAYQCVLEEYAVSEMKEETRVFKYFFKKPKFIRMEVIQGRDKGSIAVYNQGKVKGKKRGLFSFITVNLDLSHERVTNIRGDTIEMSDWYYLLNQILIKQKKGISIVVEREFYRGKELYLLQVTTPQELIIKEKVWIDMETFLPVYVARYAENNRLVHFVNYREITVNSDFEKGLFEL